MALVVHGLNLAIAVVLMCHALVLRNLSLRQFVLFKLGRRSELNQLFLSEVDFLFFIFFDTNLTTDGLFMTAAVANYHGSRLVDILHQGEQREA